MSSIIRADRWQNSNGVAYNSVLQVVSTTKTDTATSSLSAGATLDISGLTATITPFFSTSKIFVMAQVNATLDTNYVFSGFRLLRGTTEIGLPAAAGNRSRLTAASISNAQSTYDMQTVTMTFLDSPGSTSSLVYGVRLVNPVTVTRTFYVNRTATDSDSADYVRTTSTITVMEIAQ